MKLNRIVNYFLSKKYILNKKIYKFNFMGIDYGDNLEVYGSVKIFGKRRNIKIGDSCSFNEGVILSSNEKITMGNNVTLSSYVVLHTGFLNVDLFPQKRHIYRSIVIGDNVWIASHTTISAGITIGDNVVVGANSVVNRDLESGWFYAGVPVKKIRKI